MPYKVICNEIKYPDELTRPLICQCKECNKNRREMGKIAENNPVPLKLIKDYV